jgi:hypothetical protein
MLKMKQIMGQELRSIFTGRLIHVIETKGNVRQGNDSSTSQILLPHQP